MRAGFPLSSLRGRQAAVLLLLALLPVVGHAQRRGGPRSNLDDLANQELEWTVDPAFKEDVFTFARLRYQNGGFGFGFGRGGGRGWADDTPLADLMLAFRVHQITSIAVRPGLNPIDITKEELAQFPFVYMAGVSRISLRDPEVGALRDYLLNGGFMMVDDFWGDTAWNHFAGEMKRLFPNRQPVELTLDHPIFHTVYNFKALPQMPTAGVYSNFGIFYDPSSDYNALTHDPHYFTISDDKGRIMVLMCHNNHYGDGWEHEGDDPNYFHVISEGMAYPMFVNILVYAMTH
jgi:Domain of unknown function (DUF4159)